MLQKEGKLPAVRNLQQRTVCNLLPQFSQSYLQVLIIHLEENAGPVGGRGKPDFN